MKVLAYYPLHYGAEYLEASIQSIYSVVDKIIILYSDKPTFGYQSHLNCPENETQLKEIAQKSDKVEWVKINANFEGEHRNLIGNYSQGYDLLLAVDADEVWETNSLDQALEDAYGGEAHRYNIAGFVNFWKSFNHIVEDWFTPGRIYNLNNKNTIEQVIDGRIYHFGYAQSREIMEYKMAIHGHKNELRANYLQDIYFGWTPEKRELHPASFGVWMEALPFDKSTLPEILKQHPNFNKEKIS